MSSIISNGFIDSHSGNKVGYIVRSDVTEAEAKSITDSWLAFTLSEVLSISAGDPVKAVEVFREIHQDLEHSHWEWDKKIKYSSVATGFSYCSFVLEVSGEAQALMLIKFPHPSRVIQGDRIVYIDYLQVAPWNIPHKFRQDKRHKGVGSIMLDVASRYCANLGAQYQKGYALHSLPQSLEFYRAIGLNELGVDSNYLGLVYFELPSSMVA